MVKITQKRAVGDLGERVAVQFLERKGFKILERNYLKPWGEIDIIAEKGDSVRFVEVKTVSGSSYLHHHPEEMVDERKLRKLARTAELYMENTKDRREFQLDVVGVIMNMATRTAQCRLIEQAL